MAYESPSFPETGSSLSSPAIVRSKSGVKSLVRKSISYSAGTGDSTKVMSFNKTLNTTSSDGEATSVNESDPRRVTIRNTGRVPVVALLGYESYSSATADSSVVYTHSLIMPGEEIVPALRSVVSLKSTGTTDFTNANFANQSKHNLEGTSIDFIAPTDINSGAKYSTAITDIKVKLEDDATTLDVDDTDFFRVGDLIQVGINDTTTTRIEIMRVTGITDADTLVVERALYGTSAADGDSQTDATNGAIVNAKVYLPFFNTYYNYNTILSGNNALMQTDYLGRYSANNFFGYGRTDGTTPSGITPGSIMFKFYSKAYQDIPLGSTAFIPVSHGTDSKLSVSTEYSFNIIIDDSSDTTVSFTTDSSNTNFGGSNGILMKIREKLASLFKDRTSALYGYSCSVSIANGKLRFTSGSNLHAHDGTNGSKISISAGAGGTNMLSGSVGLFPAHTAIDAAVTPRLPDDNVYAPLTYASSPNLQRLAYDNGRGSIFGACQGTIDYETGKFKIENAPANASFKVACMHSGVFSGKRDATDAIKANTLVDIYANVQNSKMSGSLEVEVM